MWSIVVDLHTSSRVDSSDVALATMRYTDAGILQNLSILDKDRRRQWLEASGKPSSSVATSAASGPAIKIVTSQSQWKSKLPSSTFSRSEASLKILRLFCNSSSWPIWIQRSILISVDLVVMIIEPW
jgi:hypothetical protein